jgi:NhaP-type Na+/H+ and K+/H+ antiporter
LEKTLKTKEELKDLIEKLLGEKVNLNDWIEIPNKQFTVEDFEEKEKC